MKIDEAITRSRELAEGNRREATYNFPSLEKYYDRCKECAEEYEQLAEWLEELKELRIYKEKMEMQYLDDIGNPLEPIKLSSALKSEIMKYEFRKQNNPKKISVLDYTIMYALKHCIEEVTGGKHETI